jgi:peptide/nickel transport system ATP-binding protein
MNPQAERSTALLLDHLSVCFPGAEPTPRDLELRLERGKIVALLGPSGCGKTTTLRACLGMLPADARVTGKVIVDGTDHAGSSEATWRLLRGRTVGLLPQEPSQAFDPRLPVGAAIDDLLRLRGADLWPTPADRRARALALLADVGLEPAHLDRLPSQLSGGQLQRAALALALSPGPSLLLADEPTSALDPLSRRTILDLLRATADRGTAVLLVTHDRPAAEHVADHVHVMAEAPPLSAPPRQLRAAGAPLLRAEGLTVRHPGAARPAVDGVSLELYPGRILAVVGASGCGKTTLARALVRLLPASAGAVWLGTEDLLTLAPAPLRAARRRLQLIFQDAADALDPRHTARKALQLVLDVHGLRADPAALLTEVKLDPALLDRPIPHLSGGQRQRVAIARALALSPEVLLCDEPVSALDPTTRDELLDLLRRLVEDRGAALLLVTHDLDAAARVADEIAVIAQGRIVERAPTEELLRAPAQPVTRALVEAARLAG